MMNGLFGYSQVPNISPPGAYILHVDAIIIIKKIDL